MRFDTCLTCGQIEMKAKGVKFMDMLVTSCQHTQGLTLPPARTPKTWALSLLFAL